MEWSKEYFNISHLGKYSTRKLWVTVERFNDCAKLLEWFPGCQFSPTESWHTSAVEARKAGEIAMV